MIITEKQIMHLISIAEQALAQGFFDKNSIEHVRRFLNEIRNQQSDELKVIE